MLHLRATVRNPVEFLAPPAGVDGDLKAEPGMHLVQVELPEGRVELRILLGSKTPEQVGGRRVALQRREVVEPLVEEGAHARESWVIDALNELIGSLGRALGSRIAPLDILEKGESATHAW